MKIILAPIDFSDGSEAVLAATERLSLAMGARVYLLCVVQPPTAIAGDRTLLAGMADSMVAAEKIAARKLATAQERLRATGITVDTLQGVGSPVEHIVAEAERTRADYIVMGSHGHTALYDLIVGSTTHGVLLRAHCPLIIVPVLNDKKARRFAAEHFAPLSHIG